MVRRCLSVLIMSVALGPVAHADAPVAVTTLFRGSTTAAGQPIVLPGGAVQVTVSQYVIAPGAVLPVHRHPYERYGYVQAGTLRVTNQETGIATVYKTGDVIIEMINVWHSAENIGSDAVRLLIFDQAPPGENNTEIKPSIKP